MSKELEAKLELHRKNEAKIIKHNQSIKHLSDRGASLQKEIDAVLSPVQKRAKRLEIKIHNTTMELQKALMTKHELEGVIKYLGGTIPPGFEMKIPDPIKEVDIVEEVEVKEETKLEIVK